MAHTTEAPIRSKTYWFRKIPGIGMVTISLDEYIFGDYWQVRLNGIRAGSKLASWLAPSPRGGWDFLRNGNDWQQALHLAMSLVDFQYSEVSKNLETNSLL